MHPTKYFRPFWEAVERPPRNYRRPLPSPANLPHGLPEVGFWLLNHRVVTPLRNCSKDSGGVRWRLAPLAPGAYVYEREG